MLFSKFGSILGNRNATEITNLIENISSTHYTNTSVALEHQLLDDVDIDSMSDSPILWILGFAATLLIACCVAMAYCCISKMSIGVYLQEDIGPV